MDINVYEQYFRAEGCFNEIERHGALVMLMVNSGGGEISYKAAVTFFPHNDETDYGITYDAYFEKELFSGKGRRSRKKEEGYLKQFREIIDELAKEHEAKVFWDEPLREERRG